MRPARSRHSRRPYAEAIVSRTLANGARLYVLENHLNPTVAVSGSLHAGGIFAVPGRRIVAAVTAGELSKGTQRHTKLEIAEELESRGASISFSGDSSDPIGVDIGASALSRHVDLLLDRLIEILTTPVFPADELDKEKKRLIGAIRQQQDQTSVRSYEAAMRRIYPAGHPFHRLRGEELVALVDSLVPEDLMAHYRQRYGTATLQLVAVGDIEAGRVLDLLEERLASWTRGPGTEIPLLAMPPPAPAEETVEMAEKASADVVMACPSNLTRPESAYLPCTLANAALGQSSLTSRLGVRVRDREGLTYGIHSAFHATHLAGPFSVTLTVKPENRAAALESTLDEIGRFLKTGLTQREFENEKSSRIGKFKVDLGSNAGLASAIDAAVYYGLGTGYLDAFPELVAAITREQADVEFRKRVDPGNFTIVSAGSFSAPSS